MKEAWRTLLCWLELVSEREHLSILASREKRNGIALANQRAGFAADIDTVRKDYEAQRKALINRHLHELEKARQTAGRIIDNCTSITFHRCQFERNYVVSVAFDERMMGGLGRSEDLRMIAEYVGRKVEEEIASTRFVKSAQQADIDRRRQHIERAGDRY